eukprot:comp22277_c0_seq1/m.53143 comp22277_c0_seq1/g.53143  ORF comp22277_c0_seq1/g.53143 comp22277_c0_seq1/m.53143 type:complete len:474 (+) comp22277_c0_seq1:575-1996(+)
MAFAAALALTEPVPGGSDADLPGDDGGCGETAGRPPFTVGMGTGTGTVRLLTTGGPPPLPLPLVLRGVDGFVGVVDRALGRLFAEVVLVAGCGTTICFLGTVLVSLLLETALEERTILGTPPDAPRASRGRSTMWSFVMAETSHTSTERSESPVSSRRMSGENVADDAPPKSLISCLPERASQMIAVVSSLAVATNASSGANSALSTQSVWPSSLVRCSPVVASHSTAERSQLALTSMFLAALLNRTAYTQSVCDASTRSRAPVMASHSITAVSLLAVAMQRSSAEKSTPNTASVWPTSTSNVLPDTASHTRAVRSSLPETTFFPSRDSRAQPTQSPWPSSTFLSASARTSHSRTDVSADAVTSARAPNATLHTVSVWPSSIPSDAPESVRCRYTLLLLQPIAHTEPSGDTETLSTREGVSIFTRCISFFLLSFCLFFSIFFSLRTSTFLACVCLLSLFFSFSHTDSAKKNTN